MTKESVRRWIAGHEAASERDRLECLDNPRPPEEALERLVSLVGLAIELHGWPLAADAVTTRELQETRDAWNKLRTGLARR